MTQDTPTVYLERLNLVAGELTPAADGRTFEVYDPSTARPYATEPDSGAADVDKAVASAKRYAQKRLGASAVIAEPR